MKANILLVDDEESIRYTFGRFLEKEGHCVDAVKDLEEALDRIEKQKFDFIFTDLVLGCKSGLQVLREVKGRGLPCPVIIITGYPNIESASESVRLGAFDYIPKPIQREALVRVAALALQHKILLDEKERYLSNLEAIVRGVAGAVMVARDDTPPAVSETDGKGGLQSEQFIGQSAKMQKIYSLIRDVSQVQTTVLITGESGTGKELAAEAIHYQGSRARKPLVKVNCSALTENLLESELFGHVKGAFTGAVRNSIGRFQKADGGTLFLDEIGDISPRVQSKLLRVLQDRSFERVGDSTNLRVNVRIVAATNQDLREKVRRGDFREDLYYRLKVVEIAMPPLRERREDIPLLIEHFLMKFNAKFGKNISAISPQAKRLLMKHRWPGNVRELEHAIEHAFILGRASRIAIDDLPADVVCCAKGPVSQKEKKTITKEAVLGALGKTGLNKTKAARLLGISRQTIYRKISGLKIKGK